MGMARESRVPDRMRRYGFALLILAPGMAAATIPVVREGAGTPAIVSFFVILLSAWYGGLGPGLVTTALTGAMASGNPTPALEGRAAGAIPRRRRIDNRP